MMEAFREGGPPMYFVLMLAVLGHAGAIVGFVLALAGSRSGARVAGAIALALGLVTLAAGYLGWRHELGRTQEALVGVDPQYRETLRAQGEKEAGRNLTFGRDACVLPVAGGALLLLRRRRAG